MLKGEAIMEAVKAEELIRAVRQVFSSMLGLELVPAPDGKPPDFPPDRKVSSSVGISGDWNGAVVFECGTLTACHLTAAMMGGPQPTCVDESVKDVVGEITNMVAGNFKNSLPGHSSLTLPCFIEGSDYSMDIVQGKRVLTLPLLFDGRGVILSVIEASRNK